MSDIPGTDRQYAILSLAGSQNLCQTITPTKVSGRGDRGIKDMDQVKYGAAEEGRIRTSEGGTEEDF